MALNKIYGIKPEENTCSDLVPMSYFYFIMKNIEEIKTLMSDEKYEDGRQPLLVHLDVLVMFVKRYPNTASMCLSKIKRKQIKKVFEEWWIRNEKKIPSKYRIGIKENADYLFSELMSVETWEKSE